MCPGLVPGERCLCSYFICFRRALLQNPSTHLGRSDDHSSFVVATPPRVVVVQARIGRDDAFSTIMPGRTQRRSFFGPPRHASKATRTPLEPPHPVVGTARPDGAVHAATLRLPRLEGPRSTERKVRISSTRTVRARRARLDVVVCRDVVAPR